MFNILFFSELDDLTLGGSKPLITDLDADPVIPQPTETKMANESKELLRENSEELGPKPTTSDDGIFSILYTAAKKVFTVGIIYFVGYMGWSVAWFIGMSYLSHFNSSVNYTFEIDHFSASYSICDT